MARYIDADQLIKKIYPMGIGDGMYVINAKAVKFAIDNTPTADVVPKSEADEIAEELSDTIVMKDELFDEVIKLRGELENAKAEVAREIFEEIERLMENNEVYFRQTDEMQEEFAELKKKYTEEKE